MILRPSGSSQGACIHEAGLLLAMHGTWERRGANGCSGLYRHLVRTSRKNDKVVRNNESNRRRRIAAAHRFSIRDERRPLPARSDPSKLFWAFRLRVRVIPNRSNRYVDRTSNRSHHSRAARTRCSYVRSPNRRRRCTTTRRLRDV
jgi:hypothetical protein